MYSKPSRQGCNLERIEGGQAGRFDGDCEHCRCNLERIEGSSCFFFLGCSLIFSMQLRKNWRVVLHVFLEVLDGFFWCNLERIEGQTPGQYSTFPLCQMQLRKNWRSIVTSRLQAYYYPRCNLERIEGKEPTLHTVLKVSVWCNLERIEGKEELARQRFFAALMQLRKNWRRLGHVGPRHLDIARCNLERIEG